MATVRKLNLMHKMFGVKPDEVCKNCSNLCDCGYKKCLVYGKTNSSASDWAGRWVACGMFNQPYSGKPVMRFVRKGKEPEKDCYDLEGQMCMGGDSDG